MKSKKIDLRKVADALTEQCPFIMFAMISGLEKEGRVKWLGNLELSVFICSDTGTWHALEQVLPVITAVAPEAFWQVILLNRVDPLTRLRALQGLPLFIREGNEQHYQQFVHHTHLDYRILRAHQRKTGIIDND
ncbi:MAG: hypothetical protein NT040_15010 [Bacteroidetes bacterium]|nr:hypothetical protein [Bacteroidota bacterium]